MLADALGTYAAALILIVVSTAIGSGVLAAAGARTWSPTSAVVGLAAASVIAWWSVRLPGHGMTALLVLIVVAIIAGVVAAVRLSGIREGLARCWPTALVALFVVSIPFAAEGHFGVLGTGFNVDMSQHLFAADWLADPTGLSPSLIRNGYPLGPHALAVAAGEVTGELTIAFTGITIAVPVLLAVAAMAAVDSLSRVRAVVVAVLTAVAYLAASYLAQGAFKELFEAAFLLGFALWLRDLTSRREPEPARGPLRPPAGRGDRGRCALRLQLAGPRLARRDPRTLGPGRAVPPARRSVGADPPCVCPARSSGSSPSRCSPPPRQIGSASSGRASTPSPSGPRNRRARGCIGAPAPPRADPPTPPRARPASGPTTTTRSATCSGRSTPARCSGSGRAATSASIPATARSRRPSSTSAPPSVLWRWRSARSPLCGRARRHCSPRSPRLRRSGWPPGSAAPRTRPRRRCR